MGADFQEVQETLMGIRNPFEITKAVDFDDVDIERNYVPFGGTEGTAATGMVSPRTPMPVFLVGGKGGGRTHLMRHYSYPLQKTRASDNLTLHLQREGYLGVYFRCSGLNGSRFSGRGQSDEVWADLFGYYIDLWITELLLATLIDIERAGDGNSQGACRLLDRILAATGHERGSDGATVTSVADSHAHVSALRRTVDMAVNNAALTGVLQVEIRTNPGELISAGAKAAIEYLDLPDLQVTFLIDEFENLTEAQQRHFNTLIREKERPCSYLIGSRLLGIRTTETLNTGERNKQGSEFETVVMEDTYSADPSAYEEFCHRVVNARLMDAGLDEQGASGWFSRLRSGGDSRLQDAQLIEALSRFLPAERPHLVKLRDAVGRATLDHDLADRVAQHVSFPDHPLVEKLAVLRLYQFWSADRFVSEDQAVRAADYVRPLVSGSEGKELANYLAQRRSDAVAQVLHDVGREPSYAGFNQLVAMSGFLPRNLLMTLKYVTRWAIFYGEDPLSGVSQFSHRALTAGVLDAARWYFDDSKPDGLRGDQCDVALRRLGGFLSAIRLADKPSEINVSTFSSNMHGISASATAVLEDCAERGLLVEVLGGRASRNDGPTHRKFQLHPMVAPIWGVSSARRGDLTMTSLELNAIFDPTVGESAFLRVQSIRLAPLTAPFAVGPSAEELDLGLD